MQLEDYFEFETQPVERIRIRGTRIDIDYIISLHHQGMTPQQIAVHFVTPLAPETVYATITYYLQHKTEVDAYLERGRALAQARYEEYLRQEPSPAAKRLRELKAARVGTP
jgi:uncharacterized protein (DUF433 family)